MHVNLILGLGQRFRRDDSVGLVLADRLQGVRLRGVRVVALEGGLPILWEHWSSDDSVLLIDAAHDASPPGTVKLYDLQRAPPEERALRASSHGLGVIEAVEIARELGRLPRALTLAAITGEDFSMGERLSPRVVAALAEAQSRVVEACSVES